jgi:light-regulated signal transduction histidine kinase (bacteriophytochrome)
VDVSTIATEVATELHARDPKRRVDVAVEPRLRAAADPRLVRIALENLLGNAWKFTRDRADARVEFGARQVDGDRAFYVSDNGAGFDMAYAGKLFQPFQRLHHAHEYEGTGIGLATLQRIVHKHGGRAWAEGSPGHGATFFFTLEAGHG